MVIRCTSIGQQGVKKLAFHPIKGECQLLEF